MADDTPPVFLTPRSVRPADWDPWADPKYAGVTRVTRNALYYAAVLGWPIFPVGKNKAPLVGPGYYDSTLDLDQIEEWYEREFVGDAGIGFAPALAGLAVVDVDVKVVDGVTTVDGNETLANLGIVLPKTMVSVTQSGNGRHFFYSMPDEGFPSTTGIEGVGRGIDTKAAKWDAPDRATGYVVLPPSAGLSGLEYAWEVPPQTEFFPPPVVPESIITTIRETQARKGTSTTTEVWGVGKLVRDPAAYANGTIRQCLEAVRTCTELRNNTLNKNAFVVGQMVGTGYADLDREGAYAALLDAAPIAPDFTEAEARGVLDHALDEGMEQAPNLVTRADLVDPDLLVPAEEFMDESEDSPEEAVDDDDALDMDDFAPEVVESIDFPGYPNDNPFDVHPLLLETGEQVQTNVAPMSNGLCLLYSGALNVVFGAAGSGKTLVSLVLTKAELDAGNCVLWLTNEMGLDEVPTLLREQGVRDDQMAGCLRLGELDAVVDADGGFQRLANTVKQKGYTMVVVDSGSRLIAAQADSSKNNDDDVQRLWGPLETIAIQTGCAVLMITHIGNDETAWRPSGANQQMRYQGAYYKMVPNGRDPLHPVRYGQSKMCLVKDNKKWISRQGFNQKDKDNPVAILQSTDGSDPTVHFLPQTPPIQQMAVDEGPKVDKQALAMSRDIGKKLKDIGAIDLSSGLSRRAVGEDLYGSKSTSTLYYKVLSEAIENMEEDGTMPEYFSMGKRSGHWVFWHKPEDDSHLQSIEDLLDDED